MPLRYHALLLAFDLVALTVLAFLLWRRRESVASWPRDARVFLYGACALGIIALLGAKVGGMFFVLRIWGHVLFCVTAPLMILRGAWHLRRRSRAFGGILLTVGLLLGGTFFYAVKIEPHWLEVTNYTFRSPRLDGVSQPIKVVVLADLQTDSVGPFEAEVFAAMDAQRADLILLPGDYLQLYFADAETYEAERRKLVELFNSLQHRPRYGIWGVDGDTDYAEQTFEGSVARPIGNAIETLKGGDGYPDLQLVGLRQPASRRPIRESVRQTMANFDGLSIVMGHAPDFLRGEIASFDPDSSDSRPHSLCVAGHTHGGQVSVPFFGPLITLTSIPRHYAAGGLFGLGDTSLFVSRGIGLERGFAPRLRFNCRPELAVITMLGTK